MNLLIYAKKKKKIKEWGEETEKISLIYWMKLLKLKVLIIYQMAMTLTPFQILMIPLFLR